LTTSTTHSRGAAYPVVFLISDVIIHPIHPSIIARRIHGPFFSYHSQFPPSYIPVSNKDFLLSLSPNSVLYSPITQPHTHVCLSVLRMSKKGSYLRLMTYTICPHAQVQTKRGLRTAPKKNSRNPKMRGPSVVLPAEKPLYSVQETERRTD